MSAPDDATAPVGSTTPEGSTTPAMPPGPGAGTGTRRRKVLPPVAAAILAAVLLTGGLYLRPYQPRLRNGTGDPELRQLVERFSSDGDRLTAIVIDTRDPSRPVRMAQWGGAHPQTRYEVGSITKGFTGLLVAQSVEKGELQLDQPIGEVLPVEGAPVAPVPLRALVTHHSGLPTVPEDGSFATASLRGRLTFSTPYGQSEAETLAALRSVKLREARYEYSNLGTTLAGQAAARAARSSYPDLLQQRVIDPLGMRHTSLQLDRPTVEPGRLAHNGRPAAPWNMGYMAPAGAVVSTPEDMTLLARAMAEGRAPGQRTATAPLDTSRGGQIGFFWQTSPWTLGLSKAEKKAAGAPHDDGRQMVWHNGASGGYTSMLCVEPASGKAAVILHNIGGGDELANRLGPHLLRHYAA